MDDVNLLKKEMFQMQQLTDTILKEKENEQKLLIREQNELKARLEKYKTSNPILNTILQLSDFCLYFLKEKTKNSNHLRIN